MGIAKFAGRLNVRVAAAGAAVLAALTFGACRPMTMTQDSNSIPEANDPDWMTLRDAVKEYESSRADIEQRSLTVVQGKFRALTDKHSHDRIGDEALFYIGRIYYDIRDYHDARLTFLRHRESFPDSEFAGTIALLEKEMDRDSERYRAWLEESRAASSVAR
jgi:TolA-binding protein